MMKHQNGDKNMVRKTSDSERTGLGRAKNELYRDPSKGKIFGVCAGIADYFGLEVWVVRIISVTTLLFFQFPILIAYFIAYFVLEAKPGTSKYDKFSKFKNRKYSRTDEEQSDTGNSHVKGSVSQVWKKGRIPGQTLRQLNKKFSNLEQRLRIMETYVTSKQFELRKEFEDLT